MSSQANYGKILSQFTALNFNENSTFTEPLLKKALDTICSRNAGISDFNLQVAEQLWLQCKKNPDDTVTLRSFIDVVTRAQGILLENISKTRKQLSAGVVEPQRKAELLQSLQQYNEDLKLLTLPFRIDPPVESRVSVSEINPIEASRLSQNRSGLQASGFFSGRSSGIFADLPSKRQSSASLKITFIITVVLFALELIICIHKNHFYSLLVYITIFSIVVMGYFDKYYMRFVLVNVILSVVFDFIWLIAQATPYWNPNPPTHHSTIQTPFLRFLYFFVVILMLGKVVLAILLFRYRSNDDQVRKSVTFFSNTFEIDGRVKENNPISQLLSGRGVFGSSFQVGQQ